MENPIHNLSNTALVEQFEVLAQAERQSTAKMIEFIQEIDRRKLYIQLGHSSLFAYLTEGLHYPQATAQRRIESARLMNLHPEIQNDLREGNLNLMQLSMVARGIKQCKKEGRPVPQEVRKALLEEVKGKDIRFTQGAIAKILDLPILIPEKSRIQKDDSVRLEITLSEKQVQSIERAKELLSHKFPNPSWAELFEALAQFYLAKKCPEARAQRSATSKMEVPTKEETASKGDVTKTIPAEIRRKVLNRDKCCQWRDPKTGKICGSRFQLQVDHRLPKWAGGGNQEDNLQVLCSVHNKWKYQEEQQELATAGKSRAPPE